MAHEITRVECRCSRRTAAQQAGEFVFLPHSRCWVFPEVRRTMSAHARYYAFHERREWPHTDHTGEHYSFIECPWCGHTLPYTAPPPLYGAPTGNGEGPEA
jgi:hypothetical protein